MKIDISPRRTGKTTRLFTEAVKTLKNKKEIVLISHSLKAAEGVKRNLLQFAPTVNPKLIICSFKMIKGKINFVDEFDHINSANLFIDKKAYYCTTLKTELGSNFTRKLICNKYKLDEKKFAISEKQRIALEGNSSR